MELMRLAIGELKLARPISTAMMVLFSIQVCASDPLMAIPDTGTTAANESLPAALVDVGIEEHLGQTMPLEAWFKNEHGQDIRLASFFKSGKPVLFNFAYYQCPMLCNLVLAGMVDGMKNLSWVPGREFEVVTLSINPREGPELAEAKKKTHIAALGKTGAAEGWSFLTGKESEIKRVAEVLGFKYQYNSATDDFSHTAAIFTLSPNGKISRYLYGTVYPAKDLRLALLDASEGKSLSIGEKLILFCYHYDPNAKGYVLLAQNLMTAGGYCVLALILSLLGLLWRKEMRKRPAPGETSTAQRVESKNT